MSTITKIYAYTQFGGGDVMVEVASPATGCTKGFFLAATGGLIRTRQRRFTMEIDMCIDAAVANGNESNAGGSGVLRRSRQQTAKALTVLLAAALLAG